uniref:Peritrophin A-like protein n=1 Tax=Spodoptera frugiperda TaxID=7108 RepID=A0A2S1TJN0_SPOFR|nr:peritrophin A-like protein [Spodoptera frugiperda]
MKDTVLLLLCAVALAHSYVHNTQRCNCDPSEARQICESNYGLDDVLVAHEYCDKFYKCANGRPVAYQCPDNLLYDPVAERCEWPNEVNCGNRPISDGNDCNGTDVSSSTQEPVSSSSSSTTSRPIDDETCNCRPEEAPSICAADGSDGVLVANENCNQFYICDHGKPVALSCPGNLLYNPYIEQCDWPENVDCGDRVVPDPSQTPPPGPGSSPNPTPSPTASTPSSGACNCRPEEAPSICAADGSDGVLVAHEICNKFYKCNHGKPVSLYCYGNLLYNPYIEQCDWPENVVCGQRVVPDPGPTRRPGSSQDHRF